MIGRIVAATMVILSITALCKAQRRSKAAPAPREQTFAELEQKLTPLATKLEKPLPGEWLHEHKEAGQTFAQYLQVRPVRRSPKLKRIYVCLLGDFGDKQMEVLDRTREYLALFYETPVEIRNRVAVKDVPEKAKRVHPTWGDSQILSTWVLNELLKPSVPEDALAYLAFASSDLWPGENWNFVYGQANLRDRTGVWSIYRNGDPAESEEAFALCLRRTMHTASHETGHILTIQHCTAFQCNMNGVNNQFEADCKPLHLCPVCLRKVCWNLQTSPKPYLFKLLTFCQKNEFNTEADWYAQAILALDDTRPPKPAATSTKNDSK